MQALLYAAYDLVKEFDKKKLDLPEFFRFCRPSEDLEVPAPHQEISRRFNRPPDQKSLDDLVFALAIMSQYRTFLEHFANLDSEQLVVFLLALAVHQYEPYQAVCRMGEPPTEVFYVLGGKVAVTNVNNKILNAEILEGRIFHLEEKGATLGDASILFSSNR